MQARWSAGQRRTADQAQYSPVGELFVWLAPLKQCQLHSSQATYEASAALPSPPPTTDENAASLP